MGLQDPIKPSVNSSEIIDRSDLSEKQSETEDEEENSTFIPPLQQKIELLKKAVNVDNFYGQNDDDEINVQPANITINIPKGQSSTKIDLTVNGKKVDSVQEIKKLAGIPAAAIFTTDDETFDD